MFRVLVRDHTAQRFGSTIELDTDMSRLTYITSGSDQVFDVIPMQDAFTLFTTGSNDVRSSLKRTASLDLE